MGNYKSDDFVNEIVMQILAVEKGLNPDYFDICKEGTDCYYTETTDCLEEARISYDKALDQLQSQTGEEGYKTYEWYLEDTASCME